jgi:acyl carrier protein
MNPSPEEASGLTDTEAKLAAWWKDLLGVEVVRPEDHFLEIGGNSLMATVLSNRIENELGVEVSMVELFNTLRAVATLCDELRQEQNA